MVPTCGSAAVGNSRAVWPKNICDQVFLPEPPPHTPCCVRAALQACAQKQGSTLSKFKHKQVCDRENTDVE